MKKMTILAALVFAVSACAHKEAHDESDEEMGGGDRVELELQEETSKTA